MTDSWKPFAHRGELTLKVLTRARAEEDGIAVHPDAAFVLLVYPDDDTEALPISTWTVETVCSWVREMAPREILVLSTEAERDRVPLLVAALERADDARLH